MVTGLQLDQLIRTTSTLFEMSTRCIKEAEYIDRNIVEPGEQLPTQPSVRLSFLDIAVTYCAMSRKKTQQFLLMTETKPSIPGKNKVWFGRKENW